MNAILFPAAQTKLSNITKLALIQHMKGKTGNPCHVRFKLTAAKSHIHTPLDIFLKTCLVPVAPIIVPMLVRVCLRSSIQV